MRTQEAVRLSEAFSTFAAASGSLERTYGELRETVRQLKEKLEERNAQLAGALAEAEGAREHMRCVLESIEEAIIVLDAEGRVVIINRAAARMFGVSLADAAGRPFAALGIELCGEGSDAVLSAGGRRYNVIQSRSTVVNSRGRRLGTVLLVKDVTRMKELESHYERNRRLIQMGEMAAKIVHEIRSPLCSIELYAGMLEAELGGTGPRDLVAGIVTGIRSLNNVLTNMLYFARHPKISPAPVNVEEVLNASILALAPMIEGRNICLCKRADPGIVIEGDAELLKQAFLNVLLNAVQAVGEGGRVEVALRREKEGVVAAVSDDGPGIPEEDLERVFDPFFSTKEKGTGLGLAIASRIVQTHGGFLLARSAPGRGSTFEFHLPARPCAGGAGGEKAGVSAGAQERPS